MWGPGWGIWVQNPWGGALGPVCGVQGPGGVLGAVTQMLDPGWGLGVGTWVGSQVLDSGFRVPNVPGVGSWVGSWGWGPCYGVLGGVPGVLPRKDGSHTP